MRTEPMHWLRKLSPRCVFIRRFTSGQRAFDLHARAPVAPLKRLKGFCRVKYATGCAGTLRLHPPESSTDGQLDSRAISRAHLRSSAQSTHCALLILLQCQFFRCIFVPIMEVKGHRWNPQKVSCKMFNSHLLISTGAD